MAASLLTVRLRRIFGYCLPLWIQVLEFLIWHCRIVSVLFDVEKCCRDTTSIFLRCGTWLQVWLSFVCHTAEKLQTENQLPYIYSYPFWIITCLESAVIIKICKYYNNSYMIIQIHESWHYLLQSPEFFIIPTDAISMILSKGGQWFAATVLLMSATLLTCHEMQISPVIKS